MKKKLYITRAIKIFALIMAVLVCSMMLQHYFLLHYDANKMRLDGFYIEEKDSLDVVLVGASDCYADFIPGLAYEKYGITSYSYATASCTAGAAKTMIKEVMRTQNPQKILIEINSFLYGFDNENRTSSVRSYIDNVPYNQNKIEYLGSGAIPATEDEIEYYIPLIKYHGTWNDYPEPSGKYITQIFRQHSDGTTKLKGYRTSTSICVPDPKYPCINDTLAQNGKTLALMPDYEEKLRDLIGFIKDEGYADKVLFVRMPHLVNASFYARFKRGNAAGEIIKSSGMEFINFERDPETLAYSYGDYYNVDHLNVYGAAKFTDYLCGILTQKYGVTSRDLTQKQKQSWDTAAEYYHKLHDYCDSFIKNETAKSGYVQTIEENSNVMKYIDDYAETGKLPEIKPAPSAPTEEPEI